MAGVDANARIALFFGTMKMALEPGDLFKTSADVGGLRLQFLDTNTIRQGLGKPLLQAFAGGGADAIEVKAG